MSPEYYQCHEIFVKAMQQKRISDMVFFKHKYTQPTVTLADAIVKALQDMMQALQS